MIHHSKIDGKIPPKYRVHIVQIADSGVVGTDRSDSSQSFSRILATGQRPIELGLLVELVRGKRSSIQASMDVLVSGELHDADL